MTGIEMMLKSMGVNPEKIKAELTQAANEVVEKIMKEVTDIKATQQRIEFKLDAILAERDKKDEFDPHTETGVLDNN